MFIGCPDSSTETKQGAECQLRKGVKWIYFFLILSPQNADVVLNTLIIPPLKSTT